MSPGTAPLQPRDLPASSSGDKILRAAAATWFALAALGQLAFAAYVVAFYGRTSVRGEQDRWNEVLVGGWRAGGIVGNAVLTLHLALAVSITVGGPLQLIPCLRARMPGLHRWNGRIYAMCAIITSGAGLYAVWTRGTAGGVNLAVGISVNGALIIAFAILAWRRARDRDIFRHRRWALRLFVVVNGVWFFRVALMLWLAMNRGPVALGDHFDGPLPTTLSFACYLGPLAILEWYFRAQASTGALGRLAMATSLFAFALAMAVGTALAFAGLWLPRM